MTRSVLGDCSDAGVSDGAFEQCDLFWVLGTSALSVYTIACIYLVDATGSRLAYIRLLVLAVVLSNTTVSIGWTPFPRARGLSTCRKLDFPRLVDTQTSWPGK